MSSGGWARNETVAAKRRVSVSVVGEAGTPAPPGTDFTGMVFISGVSSPDYVAALGTFENNRRALVIADDVVESVDTGADTLELTGHGYETGDGPFDADEVLGAGIIGIGIDFWLIKVDADNVAVAASLADAYSDTRVALSGSEDGATISDNASTQRGVWGEFTYEATQAETDHAHKETLILVDGPGFRRMLFCGGGATVVMQEPASTAFDQIMENGLTYGDGQRLQTRALVSNFTRDVNGNFVIRDLADTKDSHESTVTSTGKTGSNIIDPT